MKSVIKRLLRQRILKATVLRQPPPAAPSQAVQGLLAWAEAYNERAEQRKRDRLRAERLRQASAPATRADFEVRVNGQPVDAVSCWEPVPGGQDHYQRLKVTIPAGTLKAGEPLSMKELVDAYIAATAGEPGKLGYMREFQRLHLGGWFGASVDPGAGDDMTSVALGLRPNGRDMRCYTANGWISESEARRRVAMAEQGGFIKGNPVRLVGESGPELEHTGRGSGKTSVQMVKAQRCATFLWCSDHLHYPRDLARRLGRNDLRIVGPAWLQHGWRGLRLPELVVDHAVPEHLTRLQMTWLCEARWHMDQHGLPVVSHPRRPGKATLQRVTAIEAALQMWQRVLCEDQDGSACD